ncbi:MAG: Gamma-glutamyl phosphate reductase [Alphaproteobacteria bacterium MarineAlpha3_Bin2]|jgi:glutamate-5-semialdehyde dehydrogenase|nr:MAG: Gamma-glutamyl phosphate reductase [Alphaproteobacteria bacterium MarineAlpha3_Bin1]PPR73090.1 MAG: Gamma-glutamyl phosphate reductase [Alphaproteobacteria bacterium MarineAlpha3_Bin2]
METENIAQLMQGIGEAAKAAARELATAPAEAKNKALLEAAANLRRCKNEILSENATDMAAGKEKGLSAAMLDRLALTDERIEGMAVGLEEIAAFADPVGTVLEDRVRPNGLVIQRVRVPLGVIGVIYESRPNVTADAGSLCLKAGNAAILRGGSESYHSSRAIMASLAEGLAAADLPEAAIQLVPTTDRAAVGEMLTMTDFIDVIVPRGGKSLIERITADSKVPLFKHLEGNCHSYVHADADPDMARNLVVNAKMRRTGICGATETMLIDRAAVDGMLAAIVNDLIDAGCEVRGDEAAQVVDSRINPATEADWDTEYLDSIIAVKVVDGIDDAIGHITLHGSDHTDCIITGNAEAAETFINKVDSAIVLVNASTQFADGGEFGMGAEIGISTGKLHARGPVGVEQLTTSKYVVRGEGQTRP